MFDFKLKCFDLKLLICIQKYLLITFNTSSPNKKYVTIPSKMKEINHVKIVFLSNRMVFEAFVAFM